MNREASEHPDDLDQYIAENMQDPEFAAALIEAESRTTGRLRLSIEALAEVRRRGEDRNRTATAQMAEALRSTRGRIKRSRP